MKRTALFSEHQSLRARLVEFASWEMPIYYQSQLQEHHAVRQHAGMFDVSHMGIVDLHGEDVSNALRYMLANDVAKLKMDGQALYSCMLNEKGGVVDDLIVYRVTPTHYRIVWNAGTHEKDLAWFTQHTDRFRITSHVRNDLSIIAVQGPKSIAWVEKILSISLAGLKPFHFLQHPEFFIARTGYTGERGVEILMPHDRTVSFWKYALNEGITPCGLGARDTLRLEAGLNLYGQDMNEETHPYESNLGWTIDLKDPAREFIGKAALHPLKETFTQHLVGIVMKEKGVLRAHQALLSQGERIGEITSGTFSPTLNYAIALARINRSHFEAVTVERRGDYLPVELVKPVFIRQGKSVIQPLLQKEIVA
ncbi:MAG TPA: glycine cleavage system aminomethyltransferase GcvT [Coxiellaceae bacterium]|nr:glycine cleavage system aminomethyltransferase GcvT [Coxiellaceae bacterium]